MDAPESITQEKVNDRDATVVRWASGLIKVIFNDGSIAFLTPVAKDDEPPKEPDA